MSGPPRLQTGGHGQRGVIIDNKIDLMRGVRLNRWQRIGIKAEHWFTQGELIATLLVMIGIFYLLERLDEWRLYSPEQRLSIVRLFGTSSRCICSSQLNHSLHTLPSPST